jgi:hypothetical protein
VAAGAQTDCRIFPGQVRACHSPAVQAELLGCEPCTRCRGRPAAFCTGPLTARCWCFGARRRLIGLGLEQQVVSLGGTPLAWTEEVLPVAVVEAVMRQ